MTVPALRPPLLIRRPSILVASAHRFTDYILLSSPGELKVDGVSVTIFKCGVFFHIEHIILHSVCV